MSTRAWQVPVRLVTGLFLLNSGCSKQNLDEEQAKFYVETARRAFPRLAEMEPRKFTAVLSATEIALGAALVAVPFVSPALAGLGLLGYAGGLNMLYTKTPGAHEPGSLRPTEQGIVLAKDSWLTGIALALVIDSLGPPRGSRRGR
jgi:hypothetical protein